MTAKFVRRWHRVEANFAIRTLGKLASTMLKDKPVTVDLQDNGAAVVKRLHEAKAISADEDG